MYDNASESAFVQKCPALTSTALITPLPHKRPVDVKRGKSEYVDARKLDLKT